MATINSNFKKLSAGYLFPEITKRTNKFIQEYEKKHGKKPNILKLGIGDTTKALSSTVVSAIHSVADSLSKDSTYIGYGDEQGSLKLRSAIVSRYARRGVCVDSSEVFVSDGAKPDSANIQSIFGKDNIVAVQDPAYPVYVDSNVISGRTGPFVNFQYEKLVYMPCTNDNNFFPTIPLQKVDLIYLCSPNNPTGAVATKEQLKSFVDYARKNKAVIIFDTAYEAFISDENLPKSIYEIEGAKECAIEINSFSKFSGFTGVRLGWMVVPKDLVVEDSEKGELNALWNRRQCTMFNGASNLSQAAGIAALSEQGEKESMELVNYYMGNAKIIKQCLESIGLTVYGGVNAPYIWLKTPVKSSWDFFDKLLQETHVVGTPGAGFGPSGEGYFRISAFGSRENVICAVESIKKNLSYDVK